MTTLVEKYDLNLSAGEVKEPPTQARQALERQQATQRPWPNWTPKPQRRNLGILLKMKGCTLMLPLVIVGCASQGAGSADSSNLSNATSSALLDDGGTVELTGAAERTIFDIRAGVIRNRAAMKGLQKYVRAVCQ